MDYQTPRDEGKGLIVRDHLAVTGDCLLSSEEVAKKSIKFPVRVMYKHL